MSRSRNVTQSSFRGTQLLGIPRNDDSIETRLRLADLRNAAHREAVPYLNARSRIPDQYTIREQHFSPFEVPTSASFLPLVTTTNIAPSVPVSNSKIISKGICNQQCKPNDDVCSVCLEDYKTDALVLADCGHIFHEKCLVGWIDSVGSRDICFRLIIVIIAHKIRDRILGE